MQESSSPGDPSEINEVDRLRIEAQARLAAIVESSDDAIVAKNLDGIVTSWNKGAERIFGWTSVEMVGKPITIIIPEERLGEEPQILARLRAGERVDHFETVRQTKDGRLLDVSVTISPIRDQTGRVIGASKIARDITLQKRFEREILAAKQAAERARATAEEASRAKDHFLSVLSHELRTPLTPVLGAVGVLERDPGVPPHLKDLVQVIRRNVETEARLVDDLLDLTRIARGKVELHFEIVDAHAVVRSAVSIFQPEIDQKSLSLTVSLGARQHHVWADPARFQQILLNLLSNAVKFTPQDGSITVRTSNENGTVKIEVIDTGIGMEPEVMPRLFQAFEQGEQTVTRQYGGLGLGLSIVQSLVELHKASISVTSEGTGKGASFILRVDSVRSEAPPAAPSPAAAPGGKPHRILLVEDHKDTREILGRLLKALGCEVTAAGSIKEAVAAAEQQTFDLLLSDIGLPDGSGTELMKHVAARHGLKGVALSGFGQDEDVRRSRDAGFASHLTKPVNVQMLHQVIRSVAG